MTGKEAKERAGNVHKAISDLNSALRLAGLSGMKIELTVLDAEPVNGTRYPVISCDNMSVQVGYLE